MPTIYELDAADAEYLWSVAANDNRAANDDAPECEEVPF